MDLGQNETQWFTTEVSGEKPHYTAVRGARRYSIASMGDWWRVQGDFAPLRYGTLLHRVRYDASDIEEAKAFVEFAADYHVKRDAWLNWAVAFDRVMGNGNAYQVRKQIGDLGLRISYGNELGLHKVVHLNFGDLEECFINGRSMLVHETYLEGLDNGEELAAMIDDLDAIHAHPELSRLSLALADGPLGMKSENLEATERDRRADALAEAQELIMAEGRVRNSIMHNAILAIVTGTSVSARIGRDPDCDPFVETAWTENTRTLLNPDGAILSKVPDGMLAHEGPLETSAALAVAIEMEWGDEEEVLEEVTDAWANVRLIADRHLGISMGPALPQIVIEELGKAHRRFDAQIPDGAHFEDVEQPGLGV